MDLETYLKKTADEVNSLLQDCYGEPKTALSRAANHLLFAGGKRLRPALFRMAADAVNPGSSARIMLAGLSLEVTHNFTLIHDDIMDKDEYRRGKKTVHTLWGEPVAILAGDVLYARAFQHICQADASEDAKVRAVSLLARTCEEICEGQQQDMSFEERNDVTRGEYLDMVTKKTGVLYGTAAAIGSLLGGGTDTQVDAFYNYGCKIGAAFQIQDDLIDLLEPSDKSGKDQASDIREGKQTLIAITARELGIDLRPWCRSLDREDIASLITMLNEKDVINTVQRESEALISSAITGISDLPETPEKRLLADLAWYFIKRDY